MSEERPLRKGRYGAVRREASVSNGPVMYSAGRREDPAWLNGLSAKIACGITERPTERIFKNDILVALIIDLDGHPGLWAAEVERLWGSPIDRDSIVRVLIAVVPASFNELAIHGGVLSPRMADRTAWSSVNVFVQLVFLPDRDGIVLVNTDDQDFEDGRVRIGPVVQVHSFFLRVEFVERNEICSGVLGGVGDPRSDDVERNGFLRTACHRQYLSFSRFLALATTVGWQYDRRLKRSGCFLVDQTEFGQHPSSANHVHDELNEQFLGHGSDKVGVGTDIGKNDLVHLECTSLSPVGTGYERTCGTSATRVARLPKSTDGHRATADSGTKSCECYLSGRHVAVTILVPSFD